MIGKWFEVGVFLLSMVIAWFYLGIFLYFFNRRCLSFRADELTKVKLTVFLGFYYSKRLGFIGGFLLYSNITVSL